MVAFELDGIVTADGKLEVELPDDIAPGKVRVRIEAAAQSCPKRNAMVEFVGDCAIVFAWH